MTSDLFVTVTTGSVGNVGKQQSYLYTLGEHEVCVVGCAVYVHVVVSLWSVERGFSVEVVCTVCILVVSSVR